MRAAVTVACVQAEPAILDRDGTLDRVDALTAEAAAAGAELVLFPEAFIPCYPSNRWVRHLAAGADPAAKATFARLMREAVEVPGPACDRLGETAKRHGVWLAVGANERSGGTLYNWLLVHGPDGVLRRHHRKLMPTNHERLVWGMGDGSSLHTVDAGFGNVGGLICWEMNMPLARFALYQDGLEILLAPTADDSDAWHDSMRHISPRGACVCPHISGVPARVVASRWRPARLRRRPDEPRRYGHPGAGRDLSRGAALGRARHRDGGARSGSPR